MTGPLTLTVFLPAGATQLRCPDGSAHRWNYLRDSMGMGWYECQACPTVLTKAALKKATDLRAG